MLPWWLCPGPLLLVTLVFHSCSLVLLVPKASLKPPDNICHRVRTCVVRLPPYRPYMRVLGPRTLGIAYSLGRGSLGEGTAVWPVRGSAVTAQSRVYAALGEGAATMQAGPFRGWVLWEY